MAYNINGIQMPDFFGNRERVQGYRSNQLAQESAVRRGKLEEQALERAPKDYAFEDEKRLQEKSQWPMQNNIAKMNYETAKMNAALQYLNAATTPELFNQSLFDYEKNFGKVSGVNPVDPKMPLESFNQYRNHILYGVQDYANQLAMAREETQNKQAMALEGLRDTNASNRIEQAHRLSQGDKTSMQKDIMFFGDIVPGSKEEAGLKRYEEVYAGKRAQNNVQWAAKILSDPNSTQEEINMALEVQRQQGSIGLTREEKIAKFLTDPTATPGAKAIVKEYKDKGVYIRPEDELPVIRMATYIADVSKPQVSRDSIQKVLDKMGTLPVGASTVIERMMDITDDPNSSSGRKKTAQSIIDAATLSKESFDKVMLSHWNTPTSPYYQLARDYMEKKSNYAPDARQGSLQDESGVTLDQLLKINKQSVDIYKASIEGTKGAPTLPEFMAQQRASYGVGAQSGGGIGGGRGAGNPYAGYATLSMNELMSLVPKMIEMNPQEQLQMVEAIGKDKWKIVDAEIKKKISENNRQGSLSAGNTKTIPQIDFTGDYTDLLIELKNMLRNDQPIKEILEKIGSWRGELTSELKDIGNMTSRSTYPEIMKYIGDILASKRKSRQGGLSEQVYPNIKILE